MPPVLRVIGAAVALIAALAIAEASVLRMDLNPSDAAVLRLAWTARPERIEDCHAQTEEELAKLPAHMRQSEICEGTTAAYRLEVRDQSGTIVEQVIRGGGLRHDRPLYVSRDIQLPPGDTAIAVTFVRVDAEKRSTANEHSDSERESREDRRHASAIDADRRRREGEERLHGREEAVPAALSLERQLRLQSRQVVLVTYDPERRELVVVDRPPR